MQLETEKGCRLNRYKIGDRVYLQKMPNRDYFPSDDRLFNRIGVVDRVIGTDESPAYQIYGIPHAIFNWREVSSAEAWETGVGAELLKSVSLDEPRKGDA
jgi:hypothetical protein